MELKYRGVPYEVHPTEVRIINKNNQVVFRRSSYNLNTAIINLRQKPQKELLYRGISGAKTEERRFLGNIYKLKNISLIANN